tara:strand:- start:127 stop:276 length:150 start_codon:yes stop_codon:yes gene_type:complete
MINNFVYILITAILILVIFLAIKAIKRGIQAKKKLNKNYNYYNENEKKK